MGGKCCRGAAVSPTIINQKEELLQNMEPTDQQDINIQRTSPELVEPKLRQTIIKKEPSTRPKKTSQVLEMTKVSTTSDFKYEMRPRTNAIRATSVNSYIHEDTISKTRLRESDRPDPYDDTIDNSTSTDSKEMVMQQKYVTSVVIESTVSHNPEETSLNEPLSESDELSSHYDDNVSSSASTNTEKTIFRQDTFSRFTSARPKSNLSYQEPTFNDIFNESDESYPVHNSFVTSTSSDSPRSETQLETIARSSLVESNNSQPQQNIIANRNSDELDKMDLNFESVGSSTSNNSEEITEQRTRVIKSKSPNRIKSDVRQVKTVYETSSDSN
jgi:hypothetical protein